MIVVGPRPSIYNILGQLVTTVADGEEFPSGENWVEFEAGGLSAGVYLYQLTARDPADGGVAFSKVMKMVLMK